MLAVYSVDLNFYLFLSGSACVNAINASFTLLNQLIKDESHWPDLNKRFK